MLKKQVFLKFLIAIEIIAIVSSIWIRYGKPYTKEKLLENIDAQRVSDIALLNTEIKEALSSSSTKNLAQNNTVYISLPSSTSTCADLDLPAITLGWKYHCSSLANYRKIDGSGWLPISLYDKNNRELPIDPSNKVDNLAFYAFVIDATNTKHYALTTILDTQKYLVSQSSNDKGADLLRYEVGTDLDIWSASQGIIGYWPLDEKIGNIIHDQSGNRGNGSLLKGENWLENGGLKFNNGQFISIKPNQKINFIGTSSTSYSLITKIQLDQTNAGIVSFAEKLNSSKRYPWALRMEYGNIIFGLYNGNTWQGVTTDNKLFSDKKWHNIIAIKNSNLKNLELYIDSVLYGRSDNSLDSEDLTNSSEINLGARNTLGQFPFNGGIDYFIIYNRTLSKQEINRFGKL